jgi:glutaredoxin
MYKLQKYVLHAESSSFSRGVPQVHVGTKNKHMYFMITEVVKS